MTDSTDADTTADEKDEKPGRLKRFHERFMVEERFLSAAAKRNLYITGAVLMVAGLVGFFVVLDSIREADDLSYIDKPVEAWLESGRDEWLTTIMIVLSIVFGPIAMPIIILVTTVTWGVLAKHAWRPILLAGGMILGVIIVQVLAPIIARDRPPAEEMMIGYDPTSSFPSGHVMGVADFLFIGTYLVFSRHRRPVITVLAFVAASFVVLMTAACRVYLGYHWPTDAVGSITLSLVVLGLVIIVDTWRTVRVGSPEQVAESDRRPEAWGRDER
ncbi:phosphatase PAP2 family protein [Agromyces aurantiacus]|uniref:Phosphatase PAP2 family protein n=1 Tax=Agromyces aurantiacus TaxID=165814 RepID=A0ABV9R725_9MICO|nr:phosphatase PAP2 family protein [Agromyces aurantiacus]MBM7502820.1 undecaprenyl-diphosphatase [Agromyces aurantiacus]